jgi:Uma2 family endonuclease
MEDAALSTARRHATIADMSDALDVIAVPASVRFPVELEPPPGFQVDEPASWPHVEGRLEWVDGRLLYMPPCGIRQQGVATGVVTILGTWGEEHPEFFIGGNEAGMLLADDARGAEGAVWRRSDVQHRMEHDKFVPLPPILAVEVEGREEKEPELRTKTAWYLARGVSIVWLVLTTTRDVVVIRADGETRHGLDETLPPDPALPGLVPSVARFFRQLG